MAMVKDPQSLRDYGNRKKRSRRRKVFIFTLLLFVLVIVGVIYLVKLFNRTYHNYEVASSEPNTEENIVGYLEYNSSMVRYSKDGAVAYDKKGSLLWNGAYEMQDPIADTCGKYVVVADRGSKAVFIYNSKGEAGRFNTEFDIMNVEVASKGVVAVQMLEGDMSYVWLYYLDGSVVAENGYHINNDGYVMDSALSEDGKKLAVVLMSVNRGKLISQIGFYNYGEVGQNIKNRYAGGFALDQEEVVVPEIVFLDNDTVCAYKDNGFILFSMPELPTVILDKTVDNVIKSVLHNSKYTGLVLEGANESKQLLLYDLKGNNVLDQQLDLDYKEIYISGDEIILYDNLTCQILKASGKEKFRYTFTTNISAMFPINHLDRYILVSAEEIAEIKLLE
ncbi:MAG TPA: DUF5711 family protein [Mobilitalea sp.]|nr:DUF5711 family protein [Mobilitalea sp.]